MIDDVLAVCGAHGIATAGEIVAPIIDSELPGGNQLIIGSVSRVWLLVEHLSNSDRVPLFGVAEVLGSVVVRNCFVNKGGPASGVGPFCGRH